MCYGAVAACVLVNSRSEQGTGLQGPIIECLEYQGSELVMFVHTGSNPFFVRHQGYSELGG